MLKLQLTERSIAESDTTTTLHAHIDKLTASLNQSEERNKQLEVQQENVVEVERLHQNDTLTQQQQHDKLQLEKLQSEKERSECPRCVSLNSERELIGNMLRTLGEVVDSRGVVNGGVGSRDNLVDHLSRVEVLVREIVSKLHRKLVELSSESESDVSQSNLSGVGGGLNCVCDSLLATVDRRMEENVNMFGEQEQTFNLKIQVYW